MPAPDGQWDGDGCEHESRRFLIIPGPARCQCDGSLPVGSVACNPGTVRSSVHWGGQV